MCLLFFNVDDNCTDDGFRLVLVNNRDETWSRPTRLASFWAHGQCLSGLDAAPGGQGGTWLGVSRRGRIGCLLNIIGYRDPGRAGRGALVTDYLTGNHSINTFADEISQKKESYKGFILLLIELSENGTEIVRVTNDTYAGKAVSQLQPGYNNFYGVGNSPVDTPWRKVPEGGGRFQKIVESHRTVGTRDQLKEELFDLMRDTTRFWPDNQLQRQGEEGGWSRESMLSQSANFVCTPQKEEGTRTTTLLLVDADGNCDFTERTFRTPVDLHDLQWSDTHFSFKLDRKVE